MFSLYNLDWNVFVTPVTVTLAGMRLRYTYHMSEVEHHSHEEPTLRTPETSREAEQAEHREVLADLYAAVHDAGGEQETHALEELLHRACDDPSYNPQPTEHLTKVFAGDEPLWVRSGTLGYRLHFESHRPTDDFADLVTKDGKPGWIRYTPPTSSVGQDAHRAYTEFFGAGKDGRVQLVADSELEER